MQVAQALPQSHTIVGPRLPVDSGRPLAIQRVGGFPQQVTWCIRLVNRKLESRLAASRILSDQLTMRCSGSASRAWLAITEFSLAGTLRSTDSARSRHAFVSLAFVRRFLRYYDPI